jgi:hypothetical protein
LLRYVLHTGGILLLSDCYVPLALSLLRPVIVNILLFHALMRQMASDGGDRRCTLVRAFFPRAVRVCRLFSAEV